LELGHRANDFSARVIESILKVFDLGIPSEELELQAGDPLIEIGVANGDCNCIADDLGGRRRRSGFVL
jgi:hypothetical protein